MFKNIFGENPQTKLLDFLADHINYDYTVTEIHKKADISKPTLYKILPVLIKKKLVINSRTMGNSPLYQINKDNPVVRVMLKFDFEVAGLMAEMEAEGSLTKYKLILK